jgi:hypothetical protein
MSAMNSSSETGGTRERSGYVVVLDFCQGVKLERRRFVRIRNLDLSVVQLAFYDLKWICCCFFFLRYVIT